MLKNSIKYIMMLYRKSNQLASDSEQITQMM